MTDSASTVLRRARPLLGTIVSINVDTVCCDEEHALHSIELAFEAIATIHGCMSAHCTDSDVALLARARARTVVTLDRHTCAVLRAAQHWARTSGHAFDPVHAAQQLVRRGLRPGIEPPAQEQGLLSALVFVDEDTVLVEGPLMLDLGGIAKGYAVDQAIEVLRQEGVASALVNAGGDLRAFGSRAWPVDVQHAQMPTRTRRLAKLKDAAIATSVPGGEFVVKRRAQPLWRSATVQARDCMTADALTKWALQAKEPCLQLRRELRQHGARLWRS